VYHFIIGEYIFIECHNPADMVMISGYMAGWYDLPV